LQEEDHYYMGLALDEARKSFSEGEVPVGALIVSKGEVFGRGRNRVEKECDPTSHAEMVAIREATSHIESWRLSGATLYVTLEPCTMCIGAIVLARIERLVFGCFDPKSGAVGSLYNIAAEERLNHKVLVTSGVRAAECSGMLKRFFKELRDTRKSCR